MEISALFLWAKFCLNSKKKWFSKFSVAKKRKSVNHQIHTFRCYHVAKNIKGWLNICTLFLIYRQICLNLHRDDHHLFYIFLWMIATLGTNKNFLKTVNRIYLIEVDASLFLSFLFANKPQKGTQFVENGIFCFGITLCPIMPFSVYYTPKMCMNRHKIWVWAASSSVWSSLDTSWLGNWAVMEKRGKQYAWTVCNKDPLMIITSSKLPVF